jgi:hypothetical protein
MSRPPADDPAQSGIMAQALGVVDIPVSGEPTEHHLPQYTDQCAGWEEANMDGKALFD